MSLAAPTFHPVARRLRQATQTRHTQVERSALMQRLLRGQLGRAAYCDWLRDLHTLYSALEDGLAAPAVQQRLAPLLDPALARSHALAQDLTQLHGPDWPTTLQPSPPAQAYARHLHSLGTQPLGLAAHAYVRYLGDLAGGQVLARVVAQSLGLGDGPGLAFYDFGGPERVGALAARFRSGLDQLAHSEAEAQALEDEACAAFDRHGDWFDGRGPA
ncbi:biliverdin-producing heme oxygenase [Ideonella sp. 4Y11]|uniref:Biliverdin-producing heme oxygenase n=1 Tax=Ideonella aquatica TaxID=2824119 RepID=A0A940YJ73_9BURK|nr:biliverdin-producing heme oxygenase [Ideonella aquatica]MBQ0960489.1 biliverdin-producing heme oxygenase [Ideonella aquatica]